MMPRIQGLVFALYGHMDSDIDVLSGCQVQKGATPSTMGV